jgi:hypothetical protein
MMKKSAIRRKIAGEGNSTILSWQSAKIAPPYCEIINACLKCTNTYIITGSNPIQNLKPLPFFTIEANS